MLRWFALLALLFVPGAQACTAEEALQVATASLDLEFPRPDGCKRDAVARCMPLPQADAPHVLDGVLVWSWDLDAKCGFTVPSASPVHIHLDGVERVNEGWLQVDVEPREITIEPTQQWDVTDDPIDPQEATVRQEERFPVRVTLGLVGEPSAEALERMAPRDGLVQVELRAVAGATETFLAVSEIETFLLDGRPALEPATSDGGGALGVPSPSALLAALALGAVAAARRR